MAEQAEGKKYFVQQKSTSKVQWAARINLMKIAVLALVIGSGFFVDPDAKFWSDSLPFFGQVIYYLAKPYICIPLLFGSGMLTLLWCRSRIAIVCHMVAYIILGWFFYDALFAPIASKYGIEAAAVWIIASIAVYCVTIVLFAAAIDGSRTVKVEAMEGMNSIYPEQR